MASYTLTNSNSDGSGAWSVASGGAPLASYTVATLPLASANAGAVALVTNALATPITGLGLAPVGGGSNIVKVWSNGTIWLIG